MAVGGSAVLLDGPLSTTPECFVGGNESWPQETGWPPKSLDKLCAASSWPRCHLQEDKASLTPPLFLPQLDSLIRLAFELTQGEPGLANISSSRNRFIHPMFRYYAPTHRHRISHASYLYTSSEAREAIHHVSRSSDPPRLARSATPLRGAGILSQVADPEGWGGRGGTAVDCGAESTLYAVAVEGT